MGAPSADIVAEWLLEEASNNEFRPVQEVIQTALSFRMREKSQEENADLSEQIALPVIRELENRAAIDRTEGITPAFEISSEGKTAYFRVLDAPELPALKKIRTIDPKKFEEFCAQILKNLGARSWTIGGSNDKGVDFKAINLQLGERVRFAPHSSQAMVIGQAKRWGEDYNITEKMIREFIGGALLHAQNVRITLPNDAGILTPVIYAYWTTSDFHVEARKYARSMGIWYLNGIGLIQLAIRAGLKIDEYC